MTSLVGVSGSLGALSCSANICFISLYFNKQLLLDNYLEGSILQIPPQVII